MGWSSSAPSLPSGASWSSPSTGAMGRWSNYSTTITVRTARGIGNTYYIEVSAAHGPGDSGNFNPPTLYFIANGEAVDIGTASRWNPTVRYYTGSSASATTVTVYESTYSSYAPAGMANASATVAAPNYWTVSYNGNGATGGSTAAQMKVRNTALTLQQNGYTRDKYVFVEWNTKANGTGTSYAAGASYTGNAALTLYAIWKKANIPVYVNVGGVIHQVEKAYANVGGIIKECTVYLNANGTIKEIV